MSRAERDLSLLPFRAKRWLLRLYVMGMTPLSALAVRAVRDVCERHLAGEYELEVHDVSQQAGPRDPSLVATPTLVRVRPGPELRIVGKLDRGRVLSGLGLARGSGGKA